MKRRQFFVSTTVAGLVFLSGCVDQLTSDDSDYPSTPDEGTLWIQNDTSSTQEIEVEVIDENTEPILSADYVLSPEDTDDSNTQEKEIVSLNETYTVEATTTEHNATYEWEVSGRNGILYLVIEDQEIVFKPEPFEG